MKKKSFFGRARLEADKRKIIYWQTVEEGSAGFTYFRHAAESTGRPEKGPPRSPTEHRRQR